MEVDEIQRDDVINKGVGGIHPAPRQKEVYQKVLSVSRSTASILLKFSPCLSLDATWEYQFYVDFQFADLGRYKTMRNGHQTLIKEFRTLGEYAENNTWNIKLFTIEI